MPKDIAAPAPSGEAAASLAHLQKLFAAPLYSAAQRLIDSGGVFDVRVLQGGRVVTGVGGPAPTASDSQAAKHRVYVQYQGTGGSDLEGECSCGERSPCVHVAAVLLVAAKISGTPATESRLGKLYF